MSLATIFRIRSNAVNQVDIHYARVMELVEKASKEGQYYIDVDFGIYDMKPHVIGSLELMLREKGFVVAPMTLVGDYCMRVNW